MVDPRAGQRYRLADGRTVELLRFMPIKNMWRAGIVNPRTGKVVPGTGNKNLSNSCFLFPRRIALSTEQLAVLEKVDDE